MKRHCVPPFVRLIVSAFLFSPLVFAQVPEPTGWYSGDVHVHRSCATTPESVSSMFGRMTPQNLAVVSLLADSGNGEVQNASTDLPLVNGQDDPISTPGKILHWDAEWHWDATYTQYPHQALGGHIVTLGLSSAQQLWQEYTFPILDWAHGHNGIAGFAHLQFLDGAGLPTKLTCCTPIEYPVEVGLGSADFISEDIDDVNQTTFYDPMYSETTIQAYYKLLNSSFRPGFAAGTDYPCNAADNGGALGGLLTYVQVAGGQLTYRNWIQGIANGRTVVSRNGHNEFLNLTVNGTSTPGDEIQLAGANNVQVTVQWTAAENLNGTIELVQNGNVVASKVTAAGPGVPATLTATVNFAKSGWLAARRMATNPLSGNYEHYVHTAAVFVTVNNAPVRVSATDAQYFVNWTNGLLQNTSAGGIWNSFFPTSLTAAQSRYQDAKALYQQIAAEAAGPGAPTLTSITLTPSNQTIGIGSELSFNASGTYSNGATLNITAQARWTSSNSAVASINPRGLASGLNPGSTTISASLNGVSASTTLTVAVNPLLISTQSLAGDSVGYSYSAVLTAAGGTTPYSWSIASGSLPNGLLLNSSTGSITGIPTAAGTFNFTVQVTDSGAQTATKALSIVITNSGAGSCPCSIWPTTTTPGVPDSGPDSPVEVGVKFRTDTNGYITGIRFYKGIGNTGIHVGNLWSSSGSLLATASFTGETSTGWQQLTFSSPVPVTANTTYVASYFAPNGHYADDQLYFASTGVDNSPLHALADGSDGFNGVFSYGSKSSFPTSGWQSSNYWVDVVFTTGSNDTTPPSIISINPTSGAANVNPATAVSATFSEPIDPTTINASTFQLLGPNNAQVTGSVRYNASNATATFQPAAQLSTSTPFTAKIIGGNSGVKDLAGNAMTTTFTSTFTTAATASACPCSIWSPSSVPNLIDTGEPPAVELGVRFRSDVNGAITAIRFYKAPANTGTHVGNLWTNSGTLLATVQFTGESASGWQQANFSTPVTITANTTYVASYFAPAGHYSDDLNYFSGSGADNSPLHAPAAGIAGANGVYNYGSTSAFPTTTYQDSNYWIDVVFVPATSTTPPTINSVTPANNSSGISLGPSVTATFSEPMTASTINSTTFLLLDNSNTPVPAAVTYNAATSTATITPTVELSALSAYTAVVHGGSNGVQDFSGNALVNDYSWSFTTGAAPADSGPGGPILVISSVLNPFSRYYGEILSAEGLNEYTISDISKITSATLARYDIVILGDISLSSNQATMLTNWVSGGGSLIAMHPDHQLSNLLGLTPTSTELSDAYLLVGSGGAGAGIVRQTIQFHGSADLYNLNGASKIATLYSTATAATNFPAVTVTNVGTGMAAAFVYDLARSIVYTRQGNPAWSGQKRDGQMQPIRSDDLYFGAASFDPEPDWVDLNKVTIPQADEQQRLLANLILQMEANNKPLPRFWYFPSGYKAVIVMTGDDHGSVFSGSATSQRFSDFLAASSTGCSVADWQCVRATSYLFPQALASNPLTDSQVAAYAAQGFEVSVHADSAPTCTVFTKSELDSQYNSLLTSLRTQFPSLAAPKTHRMHCINWSDYDSQPQVELKYGIRLDTSYYYWPPTWINDQPGMFTGSGIPMRFTDRNGNIIDVYQATTQMTDESGQSYPFNADTLLDNALGSSGFYGAFVVNAHNDQGSYPGIAPDVIASAQSRGVPIVSALQMLTWLDGRNASSFGSLSWNGSTLTFNIQAGNGARNLQAMLPMSSGGGTLNTMSINGSPVAFTTQLVKGIQYAVFNAVTGNYQASYGPGGSSVVVASVGLNPTTVQGGSPSTGTVTLNGVAPSGGASVALSSDNPSAQVPASITIASGSTTGNFTVTTTNVSSVVTANISATLGASKSASLTINPTPITLASVAVNPTSVTGGSGSTGTVTLSAPAPTGGAVVALASNNTGVAQVPVNVTVLAGSTTANFSIATTAVASTTMVTVSGTLGVQQTASLTVTPPTLLSLTLNPTTVVGGNNSTATVTLSGPAPSGGVVIPLSSSNTAAAQTPANVSIAAGATTSTFTVTTSPVATNTSSVISGSFGVTRNATLTVTALTLSSITRSPTSVVGGSNSTGTVTLNAAAPTGGVVVTLQSSNTSVAQVPATVTVSGGFTNATFTITTFPVTTNTSVTISAIYGVTRTTTLTVNAPVLSTLSRSPSSVVGGNTSTGTATLNGPAPSGGATVLLQSGNTAVAQVPSSVMIVAGQRSASFTITTGGVASSTSVTISATFGATRTNTLTVNPASLTSLTLSPSTVPVGTPATGTLTLNGVAPPNGALISLLSTNTSVAGVPMSATIPPGATSITFTVTTNGRGSSSIRGTYRSTTRSATLTVQ